ncbi:MAG: PHP domain-containing protein [Sedimentibacter sp.]
MKVFYDLHIHSDLSPCGSSDMTPNNIINMAYIKGLNVISVTDHNTTKNLPAVMVLGEKIGVKVVPGVEVTTREEVHVLCYFKYLNDALDFGDIMYESLPNIKNNTVIFGEQNIYNFKDEIVGNLDKLLLNATSFTIEDVWSMAKNHHGVMIPAHINKKSNSILEVLGFIPKGLKIDFVEVYPNFEINRRLIENYRILNNSDAHQLTDISEPENYIEIESMDDIYEYMNII